MARKMVFPATIALVMAASLMACSEGPPPDPYTTVTLRQVARGTVVSKGFKYKFIQPNIVALYRNLGLIRDGNVIEFIAARSLEDKLEGMTGGWFDLGVVKTFSPFVHFRVDRVATETDTTIMTQAGTIAYPRIMNAAEFSTDSYEEQDIDAVPYNRTGTLNGLVDKKLMVKCRVTMEEEEGNKFFVLHGKNAKFRVADPPNGTGLIMKVLATNNYEFDGGIKMTEVEAYSSRMKTKIAGTVEVQYVSYGDRVITG